MRHFFVSTSPAVLQPPTPTNLVASFAPAVPFTIWDSFIGGADVSVLCTASDGVSVVSLFTNGYGELPVFRGPDGLPEGPVLLWIDTGGDMRTPIACVDPLPIVIPPPSGGGGGGLPAGTTLENIPNGATRLALTQPERDKLGGVAANATAGPALGNLATQALPGNALASLKPSDIGAVQNVSGVGRIWCRTAAQGFPSVAEGLLDGDLVAIETS